jgi:hypothetical protein
MAAVTFTPPKQWEDWLSWTLGIWLCLSPWILGFANESPATENAAVVGFLLILTEVVTLSVFEPWEEWLNVALGAWLVVGAWFLGPMSAAPRSNFVVVGLMIIAVAVYEMRQARQHASRRS